MRKIYPETGTIRVKTRFLFLPKWIDHEVRWLEVATWEERYCRIGGWIEVGWIDSDRYSGPQRTAPAPHRTDPGTGAKIPHGSKRG